MQRDSFVENSEVMLHAEDPLKGSLILVAHPQHFDAVGISDALQKGGAVVLGPAKTVNEALELATQPGISAVVFSPWLDVQWPDALTAKISSLGIPGFVVDEVPLPPGHSQRRGFRELIYPVTDGMLQATVRKLLVASRS
jgi:hypothetical protein